MRTVIETELPIVDDTELAIVAVDPSALTKDVMGQLVRKSQQNHVRKFEFHQDIGPPEAPGRFRSVKRCREWLCEENRRMFMLAEASGSMNPEELENVLGIAWFGREVSQHAPGASVSFGVRAYGHSDISRGEMTGQHVAGQFVGAVHEMVKTQFVGESVWTHTSSADYGLQNILEALGYKDRRVYPPDGNGRLRSILFNREIFTES